MEDSFLTGTLTRTPFARLLFLIWQKQKTGFLLVRRQESEKKFYFEKGRLGLERTTFSEKEFLARLFEKKALDIFQLQECESHASAHGLTLTQSLMECRVFSPPRLWKLLETSTLSGCFSLFNWAEGDFEFSSASAARDSQLLRNIPTPGIILQGIRRMQNFEIIRAHLPQEDVPLRFLFPRHLDLFPLEPYEKYVLNLIDGKKTLGDILRLSALGNRESSKVIFELVVLGLAGTNQEKENNGDRQEFSRLEIDRILDAFNEKSSSIYKYISMEIGPVALNVLQKHLEEIRASLPAFLQEVEFNPEGKIDFKGLPKGPGHFLNESNQKALLQALDEILMSEVLAVKRTLGNSHESQLVRTLDRPGEGR